MEQEIKKIIEQHLPAQTAGVMKDFIKETEDTKQDLLDTQEVVKKQNVRLVDYFKKDALYNEMKAMGEDLDLRVESLNEREERITKRENNAAVIESTIKMEMMKLNMDDLMRLVDKVFGHPNVTITKKVPVAMSTQNDNGVYSGGDALEPVTETKTEGKS